MRIEEKYHKNTILCCEKKKKSDGIKKKTQKKRGCELNSVQNRKFDYGSELFRQFRRKSARTV